MSRLFCALVLVLFGAHQSGLAEAPDRALTSRLHTVRRGDSLSEIALRYGVTGDLLRQWNSLTGDRILVGQRLQIHAGPLGASYTVRAGDTLSEIALRYGVSLASLRQLNPQNGDRIRQGQKLRLQEVAPAAAPPASTCYVVKHADTLSEIALARGLSLQRLRELNDLKGDGIRVGQKLRLETEPAPPRRAVTVSDESRQYTVRPGDTLSEIALRYDVSLGLLRQLNGLTSDRIKAGQKLRLRPSKKDEPVHIVRYGETLSEIALAYGLDLGELRRVNGIEGDRILVGQKLRLKAIPLAVHVVERGDALGEIARAYDMPLGELKELNGLTSDLIYPGQELKLHPGRSGALGTYSVVRGDTPSEIARLHQMSLAELRRLNRLSGSLIHPGQKLRVRPLLGQAGDWLKLPDIKWDALRVAPTGAPTIVADNGPYFYKRPRSDRQRGLDYYEEHPVSPLKTYRQARKLWKRFNQSIDKLGRLSNALAGWHFVLDPGHGGLDPGAIVPSQDGTGDRLFVVEDEYCYDIALRAYVLLRLHGANVDITILSPNHLIRQTSPATQTFVNEKNEVYNSLALNRGNSRSQWPRGSVRGLRARVQIAREALQGSLQARTMFLSFHADIDRGSPEAPLILYYERRDGGGRDRVSRSFARSLMPALGAGTHIRGQDLAVLRDNPARYKVLVELRNLAYVDHAWALRYEQLRHRDAEKLVKGLVDFAQRQQLAQR